jgi:hypothetical protein
MESILLTSMNAGPVRTGAAANGVAVIDDQSLGIDRWIALQERLLVGGPADVAVLNRVNQLGVGSEGVDNRVAIGGLLRLDGGRAMDEYRAMMWSIDGPCCSFAIAAASTEGIRSTGL